MGNNSYGLADLVVATTDRGLVVGLAEFRGKYSTHLVDTLSLDKHDHLDNTRPRVVVANSNILPDESCYWAGRWAEHKCAESTANEDNAKRVWQSAKARNDMLEAILADIDRITA